MIPRQRAKVNDASALRAPGTRGGKVAAARKFGIDKQGTLC